MKIVWGLGLLALALAPGCVYDATAHEETVAVTINHSRFKPARLSVQAGETVRFVIHNGDPIDHEFILGDQAVQDKHEVGRDRHHHGVVPGEVSVPAGETRVTTYEFKEAGKLIIGCHLPGHFVYGMRGTVIVTPR